MVPEVGGPSEREYREKLGAIREKLSKRSRKIRKDFAKIEKMKVECLKKSEELRRSIDRDADKMEGKIVKSKDLAPESKARLRSDIAALRSSIREEYIELKTQISETLIPALHV